MRTPGFTAQSSLTIASEHNRVVLALEGRDADVNPRLCMEECVTECIEAGQSTSVCRNRCQNMCRSQHYECKPQDNSVNRNLCMGGMWAWELACQAECQLLNVVPVVGGVLAKACSAGCTWLANEMRSDCPPATICV